MRLLFPIPASPLSVNATAGKHWAHVHPIKTAWRDTTAWYAKAAGWKNLNPATVTVHIPFNSNRRRDPHNYSSTVVKWVVDGLVIAGCWPDDTPEWVTTTEPVLYRGANVIVEVTDG